MYSYSINSRNDFKSRKVTFTVLQSFKIKDTRTNKNNNQCKVLFVDCKNLAILTKSLKIPTWIKINSSYFYSTMYFTLKE